MSALSATFSKFVEGVMYKGREGHIAFIFHRVSGLAILLFLCIHIVDTAFVFFWPEGYIEAIHLYSSPIFLISEYALFAAIIYHGVNGLNIIVKDTFPQWWTKHMEKGSFWKVIGLSVLCWLPAAFFVTRNLLGALGMGEHPAAPTVADATNVSNLAVPLVFVILLGVLAYGGTLSANVAIAAGRHVRVPGRNLETWSWLLMRWSGGALIFLVWIHVLANALLVGAHNIDLQYVADRWAQPLSFGSTFAILILAFAHGMNGLRHIAGDYLRSAFWTRAASIAIFVGWVAISAIGIIAMVSGVNH